jgi:hypothetical protein
MFVYRTYGSTITSRICPPQASQVWHPTVESSGGEDGAGGWMRDMTRPHYTPSISTIILLTGADTGLTGPHQFIREQLFRQSIMPCCPRQPVQCGQHRQAQHHLEQAHARFPRYVHAASVGLSQDQLLALAAIGGLARKTRGRTKSAKPAAKPSKKIS